jgi:hypothetical protein
LKKSTLLNKGQPIILTTEIINRIIDNQITSVIIPLTNKSNLNNDDYLYCKEPTTVLPIESINDFKSDSNLNYIEYNDKCYFYGDINSNVKMASFKSLSAKQSPKDITRLFLKINSSYICNIKSVSKETLKSFGCSDKKSFVDMWDSIVYTYLGSTQNSKTKNRLYKTHFSYKNNPLVQIITFDIVTVDTDEPEV